MVYKTDAEWYCRKDKECDAWLEILLATIRKYGVNWDQATDAQKAFIEEEARVAFGKRKGVTDKQSRPDVEGV